MSLNYENPNFFKDEVDDEETVKETWEKIKKGLLAGKTISLPL